MTMKKTMTKTMTSTMKMTKSRSRWQPIAHGKTKAEIKSKGLLFDAFLQMSKSNFCLFFPLQVEDACSWHKWERWKLVKVFSASFCVQLKSSQGIGAFTKNILHLSCTSSNKKSFLKSFQTRKDFILHALFYLVFGVSIPTKCKAFHSPLSKCKV